MLLHGFTGDRGDWSVWPAAGPRALAIDLPGHGDSPDPIGAFQAEIDRLSAALPASIDSLCGYSLGGRIAIALLLAAPERFRTAVIISANPGLRTESARRARRAADQRWISLLREKGIGRFVTQWERLPLFASQASLPENVKAAQRARRLAHRAEGLARSLETSGLAAQPDFRAALTKYPGDMHWIVGAQDRRFLLSAQELADRRSATALHVLRASGHNPLLESPTMLAGLLMRILTTARRATVP